ncbi:MAG TPA: transcription antitermination factor NusB [Tenuifilaceae bacterium]|nr:transcription antitermination factor NusB [Tenuifilaceae bacterium]
MINRRLLRIKILQVLFAYFRSNNDSLSNLEKELHFSIEKSYQLYLLVLLLPEALADVALEKIELGKQKFRPTADELNPNTRFVDNPLIHILRNNQALKQKAKDSKLSWKNYPEVVKLLYQQLVSSESYHKFMSDDEFSLDTCRQMIVNFYLNELENSDEFDAFLEEQSIYWNDDLKFVLSMAAKTIKKVREENSDALKLMPLYRNEEDKDFAFQLMTKAVLKHSDNVGLIEEYTQNWEVDRIASMDMLIMEMAITEVLEFPSIPVKVSLNEYIEIAKFYSTEQSGLFINGVLDKIITTLRQQKKFEKQGRGLIGDIAETPDDINSLEPDTE